MSTAELKSNLHNLIDAINDSKTLKAIYSMIAKQKKQEADWWDELPDEIKAAIDEGIAQADRGELIPHEQVMKEIKAKFNL